MNIAYKKEIRYTLLFTVLLLLCGHSGLIFLSIPSLQNHMIFGFPSQYIIPVLLGWIGLMAVSAVMAKLTNDLDDEIEAYKDVIEES